MFEDSDEDSEYEERDEKDARDDNEFFGNEVDVRVEDDFFDEHDFFEDADESGEEEEERGDRKEEAPSSGSKLKRIRAVEDHSAVTDNRERKRLAFSI